MRKPCIIIDLDNTLVDTAMRKHAILTTRFSMNDLSLDQVRDNFDLTKILGKNSVARERFFEIFDSENAIIDYTAPLFHRAKEVIESLLLQGISIVIVTGRPESLKEVTKKELLGLEID